MRDEAFYLAKEDIKKDGDEMAAIQQLIRNYKDGLSAEALSRLKKESQDDAFIAAMLDVARDEMIKDVETQLIEELRPIIEQQLKAELMKDPEFIARVKAELKSIILGL